MTREELMNDAEAFKGKKGYGYVHAELKEMSECSMLVCGHGTAVEIIAYELISQLAASHHLDLHEYLILMMAKYGNICTQSSPDEDNTLEIE